MSLFAGMWSVQFSVPTNGSCRQGGAESMIRAIFEVRAAEGREVTLYDPEGSIVEHRTMTEAYATWLKSMEDKWVG